MKQFFRIRAILLLGLILTTFFTSCEKPTIDEIIKDQSTIQKPDTANGFHKEKIAFDRIKTNKKLQTLFDIQESNQKSGTDAGVYYDADQDFGVDLTKGTYMSRGEYHSYTFPVFRKYAEAKTENLLISLQRDWSYKAFLICYDFNQEELEKVIVGEVFYGIENKLSVREIPLDGKLLLNQLQAKNEDGPWCKEIIISQATGWPVEINVKCEDTAGGGNNDDSNNEDDWGSDDSNNDDDWGGNPFDNDNGNNNDNGNDGQSGGGSNTGDNTNADEPCIDCLGDYSSFIFEGTLNRLQNMLGYPHYTTEGKWIQNIHNFSVTSKIVNILHNYQNSNESITLSKKIVELGTDNPQIASAQKELALDIADITLSNEISEHTLRASLITTKMLLNGRLDGPYDQSYYNTLNPYFAVDTHNPAFAARLTAQIAVVKWQHRNDEWSDAKIYATALWQLLRDPVHLVLDVGGLIPVVGEVADLVNGGIYLLEGDQINAALSFAGAVPFAGWAATGTKFVGKVVVLAGGAKAIRVIAKNTDHIASIANKLRDKFDLVTQRGVTLLKDKLGNVIARGKENVARVLGNVADAVNDRQKNVINQWKDNIGSQSNKRKGNFGEMKTDLDLAEEGYIPLHTRIDNIDAAGHNGIDAVMEKDGKYFIIESKFSSTTTPSLNGANPATGLPKQMSDAWIQGGDRLSEALGNNPVLAQQILSSNYTRVLATHGPNGNKLYKLVDSAGNIGSVWTP
ncbi:hypothetical protein [uncultured Aquimarina sp.]|uniref:hypothetical protein n=1 Tax=uncultured Aquimarina sp. TaxID=575652 RepID=UPI002620851E|nr:hypothetical protein [uncultured Aquimarina sp.]